MAVIKLETYRKRQRERMIMLTWTGFMLWPLLIILLLFTGVSGKESILYSHVGGTVTLPCGHKVYSNCSSISWDFHRRESENIQLVIHGKIKNQEGSGKLTLQSNCSLHINNLTSADAGSYICQQYSNGTDDKDAVILSLLNSANGEEIKLYSSVGGTISLACDHVVYSNCSSISWHANTQRSTTTTELVAQGKIKDQNQEVSGKLRMGSDCSLHINNLTTADAGQYACRQYFTDKSYGDTTVFLSLLNIFSSSSMTELKIGRSVTLHCELHSYIVCDKSSSVTWVTETGTALQGGRYKVEQSSCATTLTVTLQASDQNRKWRCQLTVGLEGEVMASHSYTTTFTDLYLWFGLGVAAAVCVAVVTIGILIFRKRSERHKVTSWEKGQSEDTVTYAVINPSTGREREPGRATAHFHTEYATVKTLP